MLPGVVIIIISEVCPLRCGSGLASSGTKETTDAEFSVSPFHASSLLPSFSLFKPSPSLLHYPCVLVLLYTSPSLVTMRFSAVVLASLPVLALADSIHNQAWRHSRRAPKAAKRNQPFKLQDMYKGQTFLECVVTLRSLAKYDF
jgi:hypothetical protein